MQNNMMEGAACLSFDPDGWEACVREMDAGDYDGVHKLWKETEYISLNECDTRDGIATYLAHNQGMCFVAEEKASIVGTILCGHDGRRGFIRHVVVSKAWRKRGIARALVEKALGELSKRGIGKCNIFVNDLNRSGFAFWAHLGWVEVDQDFRTLQTSTAPSEPHMQTGRP
jgi:ribosomal protein S18 acetylase RimI-like enzyme